MEEACAEIKNHLKPHWIPLLWYHYIPQFNILYCEIPKAGSTTWMMGTFAKLATKVGIDWKNRIKLLHYLRVDNWSKLDDIA